MTPTLRIMNTQVKGCKLITSHMFRDTRGYFQECWRDDFFPDQVPTVWRQDNMSLSHINVVRGLHVQRNNPQGKLVRCVNGSIWDVCVDVRAGSPTLGKWTGHMLNQSNALYCPPGTAHGFLAMSQKNIVYYKCTTLYDKDSDGGIDPFDPEIGIPWPMSGEPVLSEKDKDLPSMKEWLEDPRGVKYGP